MNPDSMSKNKMLIIIFFIMYSFLSIIPSTSYAADENDSVYDYIGGNEEDEKVGDVGGISDPDALNINKPGITTGEIVKTILSLIFVVGLLYLLLKWVKKKSSHLPNSQLLQNLGGISIGPNKSLQLVKVGDSILVLGVGENVQLLKEINEQEVMEDMMDAFQKKKEDGIASPIKLSSILVDKWKKDKSLEDDKTSFRTRLQQELELAVKTRKESYEKELEKGNKDL